MMFSRSILYALASATLAWAQSNPFTVPSGGLNASAGQSLTLKWNPTTQGTVSLYLREGASSNLNNGTAIATSIQNSGSYTWSVPASIVQNSDYAIEIVDDANTSNTNYTPYFVIFSSNTVSSVSSVSSMSLTSSAASASTASASKTSTASSSSPASSNSASSTSSPATTISATSTAASSSSIGVQSQTKGAATRPTALAGMIGVVALGALAL